MGAFHLPGAAHNTPSRQPFKNFNGSGRSNFRRTKEQTRASCCTSCMPENNTLHTTAPPGSERTTRSVFPINQDTSSPSAQDTWAQQGEHVQKRMLQRISTSRHVRQRLRKVLSWEMLIPRVAQTKPTSTKATRTMTFVKPKRLEIRQHTADTSSGNTQ